jgi:hypothetical protein
MQGVLIVEQVRISEGGSEGRAGSAARGRGMSE